MIDYKKETAEKLKDQIPEDSVFRLFSLGLITEQTARRFLIVADYNAQHPERGKKTEIKEVIADRYCVSFETIQKIIAKK